MKDPYSVLGVARDATQDEIKKAYRKLAKQLHPDKNAGNTRIAERFKEVSAAHHILGDEKLRARFDRGEIDASGTERGPTAGFHRAYANAGRTTAGFDPGPGAEDIFADLFGSFRRGGGQRGFRARGADLKYALTVSFLEAARGGTKRLNLPGGKTLDVKIPAGIEEGQQIRLKGQGEPGEGGGAAGDALIEVQIEPHPFFVRKGHDVQVELPVGLGEAVLGGKIEVPTIDGMVSLTVPKGSNTGSTLRLKGKGIADRAAAGKRGDQYVKLKIVLPEAPDAELERFVKGWNGSSKGLRDRFTVD
ncbi:MAG TPA: J domain-containing protein [Candidatus Sulfotelmatobacter sp.]|nr:J domain-containing protein [Candidatus Sulfotelmatobacter sp.]